jgi:hypothetical protein
MIQPGSAALRDAIGRGDELFEQGTAFAPVSIIIIIK